MKLRFSANAEILVETEALGHIANFALDQRRLANNIVTETGAAAGVRRQQSA